MSQPQVKQKLFSIVKVYLPQDVDSNAIELESHLMNDLNINSAHLVDIALDVEDTFDIVLSERDMEEMQTVSDAIRIVNQKTTVQRIIN